LRFISLQVKALDGYSMRYTYRGLFIALYSSRFCIIFLTPKPKCCTIILNNNKGE